MSGSVLFLSGLDPANAERRYIELCQRLENYGVEYFNGKVSTFPDILTDKAIKF